MNEDRGFTLIELLVVVIIIGILAAIAVPVFLHQRRKGVDAALRSDLRNAVIAAQTWESDHPTDATFSGASADAAAIETNLGNAGFTLSSGNVVKIWGGPAGGYKICAYNSGATTATVADAALQYDDEGDGFVGTPVDCSGSGWDQIS